jgi:DNA-directed RNA polymerase specialized sigma24 family protein
MIDSKTLERLRSIDDRSWGVIYKSLVLYASQKLNKAGFEIRSEKDSVDAEHFAVLAIEKVFTGVRKWDYNKYPDITHHLIWVVKSLISSHFKSSSRSIVSAGGATELLSDSEEYDKFENYDELTDEEIRIRDIPDEIFIENEFWEMIEKSFGENKDDHAIFSEWLQGASRKEISKGLDIPMNEINNSIKRGLRIVKKTFKKS